MDNVFEIIKKSRTSHARAGVLHTKHGDIETPVFMPVGTQGTVKAMTPGMLEEIGVQIILANTYHLALRPGMELIKEFGGLHEFIGWEKPILTDSGGYQVFSLSSLSKISEKGVVFQSHIDGSRHEFTPERVIDLQLGFNSDIIMPLDVCTPYPCDKESVQNASDQTAKWEAQAKKYWETHQNGQILFGIVQGGMYKDLRERSAKQIMTLDFPGYAIGGLSVGEPADVMDEFIAFTALLLPEDKPRYLMGVGTPENLNYSISHGIDMFDCVLPTRLARHGQVFTSEGRINIRNHQFLTDKNALDPVCGCYSCTHFSRAYIRHLFIANEILASILMTYHNIYFLIHYVEKLRQAVLDETL
ncbi:tRNA guanosine(34) transglycosylase Tgt [Thermoproteota archaeon]